ncbi:IclR family acetate operon transcriptional repressor [Agromyces terreus]|uniref:IclR family acetate operon transcriptional repressor n=1 Tax=Agromyces terreus TaxID=424795 RepID=A0A9X2H1K4_9MICO|nr:IclR family transcriptional regulator [Agromyces terreus]MCP2370908.1 IclR family acetate operon transcriptional repressor [Agromyces terreus]
MVDTSESRTDSGNTTGTQSVDRALQVLLQIADSPPPGLSLAACSGILGYSKPTTLRILRTLEARRFLRYDEELGVYTLGTATVQLGAEYLNRLDLRRAALPAMRALVEQTQETAHLGVLSGTDVVYIELVDSPHPVRVFSRVGTAVPAYATAIGKAILAWTPVEARDAHVTRPLAARTPFTLRTDAELADDLVVTRDRGFAVDDQENREGIRGFAAPVFDFQGNVIAAVSIAGPATRVVPESAEHLGARIVATAAEISASMGAPRSSS